MRLIPSLALACALTLTLPALASDRPDHYKGESAQTLEQALANLSEYNARLAKLVNKDTLTAAELNQVHQLTYTLENGLEKLREEHARLAEILEEVHVASESADSRTVTSKGREYIESSRKLVPKS